MKLLHWTLFETLKMQGSPGTWLTYRTHSTGNPLHADEFLWCSEHDLTYPWCTFMESINQSIIRRDSCYTWNLFSVLFKNSVNAHYNVYLNVSLSLPNAVAITIISSGFHRVTAQLCPQYQQCSSMLLKSCWCTKKLERHT